MHGCAGKIGDCEHLFTNALLSCMYYYNMRGVFLFSSQQKDIKGCWCPLGNQTEHRSSVNTDKRLNV